MLETKNAHGSDFTATLAMSSMLERFMGSEGIGVANNDPRHHDQDGHEHGPHESHDRLLITNLDVPIGDHQEQFPVFISSFKSSRILS